MWPPVHAGAEKNPQAAVLTHSLVQEKKMGVSNHIVEDLPHTPEIRLLHHPQKTGVSRWAPKDPLHDAPSGSPQVRSHEEEEAKPAPGKRIKMIENTQMTVPDKHKTFVFVE